MQGVFLRLRSQPFYELVSLSGLNIVYSHQRVLPFVCCRKPSFRYSVLFQANGYPGLLNIARTICLLICARNV